MKLSFGKLKRYIANAYKPFKAKIIILGATDQSKRHILYKICLLMRIVSKKNYTSFTFLSKKESRQQQTIVQFGSGDHKILNKNIDRERFNEGSNFKVETVIFENNKLNLWDISTDQIKDEKVKWQVWQNNIIGAHFLIYCVDGSCSDESKLIESKEKLIKILSDTNLENVSFAVLFNNMELIESIEEQTKQLAKLKELFGKLPCRQKYKLFGCSSKIIYNEDPAAMDYLNKNCNSVDDYSKLNKKEFKKFCKMDSLLKMMQWMVDDCLA